MSKASRLPSGSWRCRVCVGGIKKSFTAPTKREAELLAANWAASSKADPQQKTIGEYIDDYIELKTNILSPSTIDSYKRHKVNDLGSLLNIPLYKLTALNVQKWANETAAIKSAKTVRFSHGLLVATLKVYAPELHFNTTLPPMKKVIKELPPVSDVVAVVVGSTVELPVLLAIWQGLRMSEIRGAKKSDISHGVLRLDRVIVNVAGEDIEKQQTKTYDSTRALKLPPYLLRLISELPPDQEYLTALTGQQISKRFYKLLNAAGVPHIRFHDLRHLNASTMLALGVPDKYAMERGGWSSPSVMKSVYQHTLSAEREKYDKLINNFFDEVITDINKKSSHV